ncbi:tetraacyldisaccharide 4'-kinase [Gammaproteobacteria bacterium]|nr:tetraacyldisaccharide 4'-kinase [Gammaproteobacteria bacterium]
MIEGRWLSWVHRAPLNYALLPAAWLYGRGIKLRRWAYQKKLVPSAKPPVPVVIVGNITVGGSGKSPLVDLICRRLAARGLRPGIVARGYRGNSKQWPLTVDAQTDAALCGDEPAMHARNGWPVVVGPDRVEAVLHLLKEADVDVVISDDGLQHLGLQRDVEIGVIDAGRRLGNGWLLPAGPLRELPSRWQQLPWRIATCGPGERAGKDEMTMHFRITRWRRLSDGHCQDEPPSPRVNALAAIGNPHRFFRTLETGGVVLAETLSLPDHYAFIANDLLFQERLPLVMTAKDAVKVAALELANAWSLDVSAEIDDARFDQLIEQIFQLSIDENDDV